MRLKKAWLVGVVLAGLAQAEPVDLRGSVVDDGKVAVVGAKVRVRTLGLEAVTGNTGAFRITGATAIGGRGGKGGPGRARFEKGRYRFEAGQDAVKASMSVFDLKGARLLEKAYPVVPGAEYAFDPGLLSAALPASGIYLVTLKAGTHAYAFKVAGAGARSPGAMGLPLSRLAPGAAGSAKRGAVLSAVDTLEISHADHKPLLLPIETYVADLDTLEMEEKEKAGRLLVADGVSHRLRMLDLNSGAVLDSFDIGGPGASLYPTEDGRYGVALLAGAAGKVRVVYSGLRIEDHGDHIHREAEAPRLLSAEWMGVKPVHYVSHHGWSAIHFDGDTAEAAKAPARMLFLEEGDFGRDSISAFGKDLSGPAHGVGLFGEGGRLLVTVPNPQYAAKAPGVGSTPYGLKVYDRDWNELQDFADTTRFDRSCRGLHGEASMGRMVLFGCNGVSDSGALLLIYDSVSQSYASKKIRYLKDGRGTGTVKAHGNQAVFVGNLGTRHLARFRPAADALEASDVVELDSAQAGFEFEREHGEHLAVLTRSGRLHIFKPRDGWEKVKSIPLLTTDHWAAGKKAPKLITAPGYAYVSDPHNGRIHEIRLSDGEVTRVLHIGGQPWNLAAQGWYGAFGRGEAPHD